MTAAQTLTIGRLRGPSTCRHARRPRHASCFIVDRTDTTATVEMTYRGRTPRTMDGDLH